MSPKAAPRITPTARSMTLPRAMNSRNSPGIGTRRSTPAVISGRLTGGVFLVFVGGIEALAQLLAALEERHVLGADGHGLAGAGVAAGPRIAGAHGEGPEAAQ